jgi:hypothetical protein
MTYVGIGPINKMLSKSNLMEREPSFARFENVMPDRSNSPTEWVKLHSPGDARGKIPVFSTAPTGGDIPHSIRSTNIR